MITNLKQELENFTSLNLFRCPKCGKIFEWNNARYYPEDRLYECQKCLASIYEDALEQVNVIDYFEELYLNYKEMENE